MPAPKASLESDTRELTGTAGWPHLTSGRKQRKRSLTLQNRCTELTSVLTHHTPCAKVCINVIVCFNLKAMRVCGETHQTHASNQQKYMRISWRRKLHIDQLPVKITYPRWSEVISLPHVVTAVLTAYYTCADRIQCRSYSLGPTQSRRIALGELSDSTVRKCHFFTSLFLPRSARTCLPASPRLFLPNYFP